MAGLYPDAPAKRLAYDIDGTVVLQALNSNNVLSETTLANKKILNDEETTFIQNGSGASKTYYFLFPTPIILSAYHISYSTNYVSITPTLQYSTNTTNGVDGTWTSITTPGPVWNVSDISPSYRNNISTLVSPISNIKGLRVFGVGVQYDEYWRNIHFYGTEVSPLDLKFWHPTLDQALTGAYFDFGDVARGSSTVKSFRLKNFSTFAASAVSVTTNIITEKSPTIASQHLFSLDQTTWSASVTLPETSSIAIPSVINSPANFSPIIYFRKNTSATAVLGPYAGRMVATTGAWI